MKKLKISAVILLMFILLPSNIFANENDTDYATKYYPYTSEEIRLIMEMEETNPEFDLSKGEIVAIEQFIYTETGEQIVPTKGSIGNDYMKITLYAQRRNNTTYDSYTFQAKADWLKTPFFMGEDVFAIAWSDEFSQTSHRCNAYYDSYGYGGVDRTSQISSVPEAGVGYSVDMKYTGPVYPLDYVIITVDARKYNSSGTAVLAAEYGHATIGLTGISVSISGSGPSISFGGVVAIDTMAADISFNY